ncbi:hypothetical protein H5410_061377 [Solanum commersonii]|uniref:Uncharacterized protein n=1 Tax=Solanum commersonii TaxID=4109 RepID=A0A9J5W7K0_SOLCO|nr:hypothetical protein H5410_061377 [Solanum commersonii]
MGKSSGEDDDHPLTPEEAAAEVAFLLQAGQRRGLHVTIAPRPAPVATDQTMIHVSTPPRQVEAPRPQQV